VVGVVVAYLIGSVPFALIIAKRWGEPDLRRIGSGNLGAANVLRSSGVTAGVLVALLDVGKGAAGVMLAARLDGSNTAPAVAGFAAIVGHIYPVWLRFRGGKGVATAAGVFLALAPVQTLLALVVFAVVLLSSGYVSLGSLTSATILPVLLAITVGVRSPIFMVSVVIALFVFWTHRANIVRLRNGEEHRFGKRAGGPGTGTASKRPAATLAIALVIVLAVLIAARFA